MSASPEFDFEAVARAALAQASDLLQRWFPAGKFRGREFVVGDLSGAAGESLSVNTQTGEWADFSTDDRGRDLISLYAAIHRIRQLEAGKRLSDILGGVADDRPRTAHVTPIRTPESPEWDGIFPVPDNAPPRPAQHPQHGAPAHIAEYRDTQGRLIAVVYRCEPKGQRKQVVPLTFCRNTKTGREEWRWQSLPKPRSLYRAELLTRMPDAPVLLVEGEPKCDAANDVLPENWIVLSWPNGAQSWKQADWAMLAGRSVTIWPDADEPGREAARQIADQLPHHRAAAIILTPPPNVPAGWDIADAIEEGWDAARLLAFITPSVPTILWHSDEPWDESAIPRRQWIAKGYLERANVSLVAGAGAAGKSMLFKAWAVAAALGLPFHRFAPAAPYRVLSYNVEDDLHEERRRLSATLRYFNRVASDLRGNLRIVGPNDIGTLIERDPNSGRIKLTEAMDELVAMIKTFKPDIVMLDPMVELHTTEENDNTGLRAILAQFRKVAIQHETAILIAHHVRKGAIVPGDPDGVRGAGAIVGAARIVFTVCTMSDDEAANLGIPKESRKFYFRLDGAKINHAPIVEAEWFQRTAYTLANGEDVAAAVPWAPPRDTITLADLDAIKAAVAKGFGPDAYTFRKGFPRSLVNLCHLHGITTDAGLKEVAEALKTAGFAERKFRDSQNRNAVNGIRSPEGEPAHVHWIADDQG
jgi:hypothetical protein